MSTLIRQFKTSHFRVIVDAVEEHDAPDLSWDDTGEVACKLDAGVYVLFCARARVVHDTLGTLAEDYLGCCIYESYGAFQNHRGSRGSGSYFSDMVKNVCRDARRVIRAAKNIRLRENAS